MTHFKSTGVFLRTAGIFKVLSDADADALAASLEERDFEPGAEIICEGGVSDRLFIVRSGFVNVTRGNKDNRVFLATIGQGEYFGEAALFDDMKRTANAESSGQTRLLTIDKVGFRKFLDEHPAAASKVLFGMLQALFRRLSETSAELEFERKGSMSQNAIDKLFR